MMRLPQSLRKKINMEKAFLASRYDKGEAAYINCPMNKEEFNAFYDALVTAEVVPLKEFEKEIYFEGCMPIEILAKGGENIAIWALKPVGLVNPRTGK